MTVKVTKPSINVREELADLKKPTGLAGEAMLRAETPQEQFNLIGAGRRNLIINGDFSVWQRGTSFTGGNTYGSADRWVTYASGNGLTYSRSTNVPSGSGLAYSMTTSGTPSGEFILSQGIELPAAGIAGVFYKGQQITISYYAKSSVSGDKLRHFMAFRTGSSSSSNQAYFENNSDQNTLSTEWKKFSNTYTITVDPHSTSLCLAINIRSRNAGNTGSTPAGNISVTGVQLEVGRIATPFEHRSYGEELALCKRYFQRLEWGAGSMDVVLQDSTTGGVYNVSYVTKRADPTIALPTATRQNNQANGVSLLTSGGSYRSSSGTEAIAADRISKDSVRVRFSGFANSGAIGDATWAYYSSNTGINPYIDIAAEL